MSNKQQQLFCTEIIERAPAILDSGEWTDCKFLVGVEPHQVVVGGYKIVMAMASPVFEAMFYGSLAETKEIAIPDVEPEIFKAMLQYMHKNNVDISSWTEGCQLYYAAKKYMMKQLMELCYNYLKNALNAENVCQIYEHALLFEDNALTQDCIKVFSDFTIELLKDNSFIAANVSTVTTIFSQNILNIDSELDLIEAAARYIEAHDFKSKTETPASSGSSTYMVEIDKELRSGKKRKIAYKSKAKRRRGSKSRQVSHDETLNKETDKKQLIRSAVEHIRFLTLTPQQYNDCAAKKSLLMDSEEHALLRKIGNKRSTVPMPTGFSTSRVKRVSEMSFYTRIYYYGNILATSEAQYFRKRMWKVKLAPCTCRWKNDSLRLSLLCANMADEPLTWSCDASAEVRVISHRIGGEPMIFNFQHVFSQQQTESEPQLLRDESYNNCYLKDGCAEMDVLIKINKMVNM